MINIMSENSLNDQIVRITELLPKASLISSRDKLILSGLYFSKFDSKGLKKLGFDSFSQAFNTIGFALGARPASIKNYRDEFDPFFPNRRKGWHKRPFRDYCKKVLEQYQNLDLETFSAFIQSITIAEEGFRTTDETVRDGKATGDAFAKRLITGLAAERYFEAVHSKLPILQDYDLENTTQLGCGFDFRLSRKSESDFLAVEVKGLNERHGAVALTPKEYTVASAFRSRFILFVVRNFRETPSHDIYTDPLAGNLSFTKQERKVIQVTWVASV